MKGIKNGFLALALLCASSLSWAQGVVTDQAIIETPTLAPVYAEAMRQLAAGKNPLVIFDIDNTLMYHEYFLGNEPWFGMIYTNYLNELRTSQPERADAEERCITWLTVMLMNATPSLLTEADAPAQIRELQKAGLKVMAQTSRNVLIAAHTVGELRHFGIDFSSSAAFGEVREFWPWNKSRSVICSRGACFGQLQDKGKIFLALMEKTGYRPKSVIFADDSKKNIASLAEALKGTGIAYTGFRYSKLDGMMKDYHAPEALAAARVQLKYYFINGSLIPNSRALTESRITPVSVREEVKWIFGPQAEPMKR